MRLTEQIGHAFRQPTEPLTQAEKDNARAYVEGKQADYDERRRLLVASKEEQAKLAEEQAKLEEEQAEREEVINEKYNKGVDETWGNPEEVKLSTPAADDGFKAGRKRKSTKRKSAKQKKNKQKKQTKKRRGKTARK
jgi:CO dehydrogenase/acetyl-CoA synthase delta subunit